MCPLPIWVGVLQRVVHAVGISVEVLGAAWILHVVVNREEGAGDGVIDPAVHVDESEVRQMLVSGEAAVVAQGLGWHPAGVAALVGCSPGIEEHVLHHHAGPVGDGGPAAEVVGVDVIDARGVNTFDDAGETVEPVVCKTLLHVLKLLFSFVIN